MAGSLFGLEENDRDAQGLSQSQFGERLNIKITQSVLENPQFQQIHPPPEPRKGALPPEIKKAEEQHKIGLSKLAEAAVAGDYKAFEDQYSRVYPNGNASADYQKILDQRNSNVPDELKGSQCAVEYTAVYILANEASMQISKERAIEAAKTGQTEEMNKALRDNKAAEEKIAETKAPENKEDYIRTSQMDIGNAVLEAAKDEQTKKDVLAAMAAIGYSVSVIMELEKKYMKNESKSKFMPSTGGGLARSNLHDTMRESLQKQTQELDEKIKSAKTGPNFAKEVEKTEEYQELKNHHGEGFANRYINSKGNERLDDALEQQFISQRMVGPSPDINGLRIKPAGPVI